MARTVDAGRLDSSGTLAWAERAQVIGGRIYRTVGRCSESVNSGDNHLAQVVYAGRLAKAEVVYGVLRLGENDERHEETCRNCKRKEVPWSHEVSPYSTSFQKQKK